VNFLTEDESARVASVYGPNYERLRDLKSKYDPDNLFRMNHNIPPAIDARSRSGRARRSHAPPLT
jgi:FAD/FMN-containing dehydrogenase